MRTRAVFAVGAAVVTATCIGLTGTAGARPTAASHAPASRAASAGGPVIITLKAQFPDLKVKKQGHQRRAATRSAQRGLLTELRAHGAKDVRQLVSVDAVSATVPAAEISRLQADPAVASIQRDATMYLASAGRAAAPAAVPSASPTVSSRICPKDPSKPLLEPEALGLTHFLHQPERSDDAATIATGKGVRVGLTGVNHLAGNPNFIRPNGEHVVVDSPTPDADNSNLGGGGDEWYGDASTISGQGTVTYDFSHELPYSGLPQGCTFRIVGIAPDASLVDTGFFGQGGDGAGDNTGNGTLRESQVIAGLDRAAIDDGVSVISESYGFGPVPGRSDFSPMEKANDALVAAGITVVESSGDSGVGGTVWAPANDPLVIDVGATTSLRLEAQAWGYSTWDNNQITALSSGGTTPDNHLVDLVAPGYGGEATCSPKSATCPPDTFTEAFGGTSESAPFVAGAAADVIQAYADAHGGAHPTPALVKQLLTGTARDLGAAADDQGAGLLDVYAAVRAAQQTPGSTVTSDAAALVPSPTQVDVAGAGGSTSTTPVTLYNASGAATTVKGTLRSLGTATPLGATVTEPVTAPARSKPIPAVGATAAAPVSMDVPAGLPELGVDMITPNPNNNAILCLLLFDPQGRLAQVSYDYSSTNGKVSNNEHVAVDHPMAGTWTARIVWNNGRAHLQDPPPTPDSYRGDISVRFTARQWRSSSIGAPVEVGAHSSATVPLAITLPNAPGDAPASVTFAAANGATTRVPVSRRTLIPSTGGDFTTALGSSVARQSGPLKTFQIDVPDGLKSMQVSFAAADSSPDNIIDYFLIAPDGHDNTYDRTPNTTPRGSEVATETGKGAIVVANPPPGRWTVQVLLDITTSGKEFTQDVAGHVAFDTAQAQALNVPHSSATVLAKGSRTVLQVNVTNTTGIGRSFSLHSPSDLVTAPKQYIPAGATVTLRGTLRPTAAPGTTINNKLQVFSYGSAPSPLLARGGTTFPPQTFAVFPLKFTVGAAAG